MRLTISRPISRLLPAAALLTLLLALAWPAGSVGQGVAGTERPTYAGTDSFWMDMDAAARAQPKHLGKRAAWLSKTLAARGEASVMDWQYAYLAHMVEANTWGLGDAAYLIDTQMDKAGFYAFRSWLLGHGHQRFVDAVANADNLAPWLDKAEFRRNGYRWPQLDSVAWHALALLEYGPESTETMLGIAREEVMTEETAKPTGKVLEQYEIPAAMPKLWAMFGR